MMYEKKQQQLLQLLENNYVFGSYAEQEQIVIHQSGVAKLLDVDRHTVARNLKKLDELGYISLGEPIKAIGDKTFAHVMTPYTLGEDIYSHVSELDMNERFRLQRKLCKASRLASMSSKQLQAELTRLKKHEELNAFAQANFPTFVEDLKRINFTRPDEYYSQYLPQGSNREHNILCSTRNPEKHPDSCKRAELLTAFGLGDFEEFDVNASIYRLAYNLTHKVALPEDVDVYEVVFHKAFPTVAFTSSARQAVKTWLMPIFFSDGTKNGYNAKFFGNFNYSYSSSVEQSKQVSLNYLCSATGLHSTQVLNKLTEALREFISGSFQGPSIFISESNLMITILTLLEEVGIKAINVYDGVYVDKDKLSQTDFYTVYEEALEKVKYYEARVA